MCTHFVAVLGCGLGAGCRCNGVAGELAGMLRVNDERRAMMNARWDFAKKTVYRLAISSRGNPCIVLLSEVLPGQNEAKQ